MILRHIVQNFLKSTDVSAEKRRAILKDTIRLLNKRDKCSRPPRVKVKPSSIPSGGLGVFAAKDFERFSPLCLYPGVYTPPLPFFCIGGEESTHEYIYLANESIHDSNEYVLNLNDVGGYLDAKNVEYNGDDDPECNDDAVGHFVNHGKAEHANVNVLSFHWNQVLDENFTQQIRCNEVYNIPNSIINDGSPWYLDSKTGDITYFCDSKVTRVKNDIINDSNTIPIAGAVLFANKKIKEGQELFLDYKLKPPFPIWARDWIEE